MTDRPTPMVPAEVRFDKDDLIPFSVDSMRYGSLADTDDARVFRARVHLMAWAWRGKPAASLSVDPDRWFRLCFESRQWWRVKRDQVMAPFVLCSDGRYYHPELARVAMKRWNSAVSGRQLDVSASEWIRLRAAVFARDGYRCMYCGMKDVPLHADHALALSRGGASTMENLVTACGPCNSSKGAKAVQEWLS